MKILLLGATGRTGIRVAEEARSRGCNIRAVVRNYKKLPLSGIEYIEGLPTDSALMRKSVRGIDAVVCSLNISRKTDNPWARVISPEHLISESMQAVVQAMQMESIRHLTTVSAWGAGDTWNEMSRLYRFIIKHSNINVTFADHNRQEAILEKSSLNWTIVRPVFLNDSDEVSYQVAAGKPSKTRISRKAVANFIIDALGNPLYDRKHVTLCQK